MVHVHETYIFVLSPTEMSHTWPDTCPIVIATCLTMQTSKSFGYQSLWSSFAHQIKVSTRLGRALSMLKVSTPSNQRLPL